MKRCVLQTEKACFVNEKCLFRKRKVPLLRMKSASFAKGNGASVNSGVCVIRASDGFVVSSHVNNCR